MPPRPSIPFEELQRNDTDTELTEPENTQSQVGNSYPILIGQLRMLQVVSASDSSEETSSSSSGDGYSEDIEVARDESRQQSSLQDEQALSLIDATDKIANPSSHDPLQTDPNLHGSDVKSTWGISSTTNPFFENNERPGMENFQEITSTAPSYPMYESLSERLRSFSNWPSHMTQTPDEMASAGFFYKGYGDFTRCFFCGGGLKDWEAEDDPLIEHARHFHDCAFVRQIQEQGFINLAKKQSANLNGQKHKEVNDTLHEYTGDSKSPKATEEKVMMSPAVTTVKEMGYSEKIKAAIHTINSRLPRAYPTEETSQNDQLETSTNSSSSLSFDDMTSLKQENAILRNQTLCVICIEKTVSIVFLPCGHLACCDDCAPAIRKCPICREFVKGTVKTKASCCLHTFNLSSTVSPITFVYMDVV